VEGFFRLLKDKLVAIDKALQSDVLGCFKAQKEVFIKRHNEKIGEWRQHAVQWMSRIRQLDTRTKHITDYQRSLTSAEADSKTHEKELQKRNKATEESMIREGNIQYKALIAAKEEEVQARIERLRAEAAVAAANAPLTEILARVNDWRAEYDSHRTFWNAATAEAEKYNRQLQALLCYLEKHVEKGVKRLSEILFEDCARGRALLEQQILEIDNAIADKNRAILQGDRHDSSSETAADVEKRLTREIRDLEDAKEGLQTAFHECCGGATQEILPLVADEASKWASTVLPDPTVDAAWLSEEGRALHLLKLEFEAVKGQLGAADEKLCRQAEESAAVIDAMQTEMEEERARHEEEKKKNKSAAPPKCQICYDRPTEVVLIPCRHKYFCRVCFERFKRGDSKCPTCRQKYREEFSGPVYEQGYIEPSS